MKRILFFFALLLASITTYAQTIISYDMINSNLNVDLEFIVVDSKSEEPIPWASAYVIPVGDTTITSFAISDQKGKIVLEDVPAGKYTLNIEMIGYYPYQKEHEFKRWQEGLGTIKLEENPEMIDAATISAVGNPIEVKNDTIIYNATSFMVGENDMLDELLKKMPGMEVGEDGTVKVNGEAVDKITVGGKTFFFNDPTVALKNLPAKIVNKIKVMDKVKDEVAFTGVSTQDDREKVMDIELKQEYTKGWFGNAKIGAGASITPDRKNELVEDGKFLYNGNAMVTGYTEKDQIVAIGNGYNVVDYGSGVVAMFIYNVNGMAKDEYSKLGGLMTSAQGGLNYNTDRIDNMESTMSAIYKHNTKNSQRVSSRISFQPSGENLYTDTKFSGYGFEDGINANIEFKNKSRDKFIFHIKPSFSYSNNKAYTSNITQTYNQNETLNKSTSEVNSFNSKYLVNGLLSLGVKDFGKKRRSLTLDISYDISEQDGQKREKSLIEYSTSKDVRDLDYDVNGEYYGLNGYLRYIEPIGEKWLLRGSAISIYQYGNQQEIAYNQGSVVDYYSSLSKNNYFNERLELLLQYNNDTTNIHFGMTGDMIRNEIVAKSMGVESVTGDDEWLMNWSPFLNYRYNFGSSNFMIYYRGSSNMLSGDKIIPAIDVSNPIQIEAGNIYLKPTFGNNMTLSYRFNNKKTFSYLSISSHGSMTNNPIVSASWYDKEGVRYGIPVNSLKPSMNLSTYINFNQPFGKERQFSVALNGRVSYDKSVSYQAAADLEGLDLDSFDYYSFIENFWGNEDGDRFYSGKSGFKESNTNTYNWSGALTFNYNAERLNLSLLASTANRITKYSLDPKANLNTWNNSVAGNLTYKSSKGWELKNRLSYLFYHGYTNGYGDPSLKWDFSLGKSIKSMTLSFAVNDILNQTRNLSRRTTDEYTEDVYSNVIGRHFLISISFNFGKMNAKKNSKVESAMWNMMY